MRRLGRRPRDRDVVGRLPRRARRALARLARAWGVRGDEAAAIVLRHVLETAGAHGLEPDAPREDRELCGTWGLTAGDLARLRRLASIRGDTIHQTYRKVLINGGVRTIPRQLPDSEYCLDIEFDDVGVDQDGNPWVRLPDGTVLHNGPAPTRYRNMYYLLKDRIDRRFRPETYSMAVDVRNRYLGIRVQDGWVPGAGGVVIEGGAYVGFRAMRYAQEVGPTGRVIAVEINRLNHEIMCRNIAANGLSGVITPIHAGLWRETGRMACRSVGYTYHTLSDSDNHAWMPHTDEVPTTTLDDLIDEAGVETVDYVNLQLNGAELEALHGLARRLEDVKVLRIAAYYSRDGVANADLVCAWLAERGCVVHVRSDLGLVTASPACWADQVAARHRA